MITKEMINEKIITKSMLKLAYQKGYRAGTKYGFKMAKEIYQQKKKK